MPTPREAPPVPSLSSAPPSLQQTQQAMAQYLLGGGDSGLFGAIVGDGVDPQFRLSIYRNNVTAMLVGALRLNFPACDRLVGEDFFAMAASRYIKVHPPAEGWLSIYGVGFSAFLAKLPEAASIPYLADVAAFEWALCHAARTADIAPLDAAALAAIPAERHEALRFAPHPSVTRLYVRAPVDHIAEAVVAEDEAAMAAIDLNDNDLLLIVHRLGNQVRAQRLPPASGTLLAAIYGGAPFGQLIADCGEDIIPVFATELAAGRLCLAGAATATESAEDE